MVTESAGLKKLAPFLGEYTTVSPGEGICPTGRRVRFDESFRMWQVDSWIRYEQRAVDTSDGAVLHEEAGVIRQAAGDELELALVMNSGRLELGVACWRGGCLVTHSESFFNDRLGVQANERYFHFREGACKKELWLATPKWPELTRHMWGDLTRSS